MGILIDCVRIANFRGIKNLEVNLSILTMLVGANNSGKTSFLKALHLALGTDRKGITRDDIYNDGIIDPETLEIIIDVRIISVDADGNRIQEFEEKWAESEDLSGDYIKFDADGNQFVAFRTRYKFDILTQSYKAEIKLLKQWFLFANWQEKSEEDKFARPKSISSIFIDAQRDIQLDLNDRTSFLGKLTNKPDLDPDVVTKIENQIIDLNEQIINGSEPLKFLKEKLQELNNTVNSAGNGVEIMPMNKKLKDIGRNMNINFKDTNTESFPLEYHGMGTRSWASLLTLSAYISWLEKINNPYFPILAIEEPEAHLHPNAQRQLYSQLQNIFGQKVISTHSPFVAAQCNLMNLRHFYKDEIGLKVGQLMLNEDEDRTIISKLDYFVLQSKGELIFSKAIVLMEGATEEQSLPLLFNEKFKKHSFEYGINFISVGGKDYLPYLIIANFLNIKWYILSDGDQNSESEVISQVTKIKETGYEENLYILDNVDFEEYLVNHDFVKELIIAINAYFSRDYFPSEFIEEFDQQKMKGGVLRNYKGDVDGGIRRALLDCLRKNKFDFAKFISTAICDKKNAEGKVILPPKINELFERMAQDLNIVIP
jgi:putative ATP-dependent endonuclease of OLD family